MKNSESSASKSPDMKKIDQVEMYTEVPEALKPATKGFLQSALGGIENIEHITVDANIESKIVKAMSEFVPKRIIDMRFDKLNENREEGDKLSVDKALRKDINSFMDTMLEDGGVSGYWKERTRDTLIGQLAGKYADEWINGEVKFDEFYNELPLESKDSSLEEIFYNRCQSRIRGRVSTFRKNIEGLEGEALKEFKAKKIDPIKNPDLKDAFYKVYEAMSGQGSDRVNEVAPEGNAEEIPPVNEQPVAPVGNQEGEQPAPPEGSAEETPQGNEQPVPPVDNAEETPPAPAGPQPIDVAAAELVDKFESAGLVSSASFKGYENLRVLMNDVITSPSYAGLPPLIRNVIARKAESLKSKTQLEDEIRKLTVEEVNAENKKLQNKLSIMFIPEITRTLPFGSTVGLVGFAIATLSGVTVAPTWAIGGIAGVLGAGTYHYFTKGTLDAERVKLEKTIKENKLKIENIKDKDINIASYKEALNIGSIIYTMAGGGTWPSTELRDKVFRNLNLDVIEQIINNT